MADVTLVIKARNEAQAALNAVKGDLQSLAQTTQNVGRQLKSAGKALTIAGVGMSAGITTPITTIGTAALLSAADFEQAMNVMQQVSGATEGQIASLQAQALQLGAETSFSAGEAAQAMLELSKAGLSASEVSAAIGGTLDLAAAGGLNLAQAAEISANAVNVFGLSASDANTVANMLAAAANSSSVEVTDLAQGLQMAGAVFASSGQSIDDLTTALALMGNAGIKGSDAGTSLKTMMMRLMAPTDEAAAVMRNLGVSVYDAEGNMRELPTVMADLQQALYGTNAVTTTHSNLTQEQASRMEYLKGTIANTQRSIADYQSGIKGVSLDEEKRAKKVAELNASMAAAQAAYEQLAAVGGTTSTVMQTLTEEQRNAALTTLFGADAIRAANVLLAEGSEGWDEMAGAVGTAGAATAVADARMRGIKGAIEYVKGSVDSFLIGTVMPFADSISGAIRSVGDAVTAFGQLPAPVKNAALAFALAASAVGPLLIGLGVLASTVGTAIPVLAAVGGALAALVSPVGLVLALVAGLAAAWATNFLGIRDVTMPAVNAVVLAMGRAQAAVLAFGASQTWGRVTASVTEAFAAIGAALASAFGGDISLPDLAGKISAELGKVATAVGGALASADFAAMKDGIVKALGMDGISLAGMQASLAALPGKVTDALASIDWAGAFSAASEKATALKDGVSGWVTGAIGGVDWANLGATLTTMRDNAVGAITSVDWVGGFNAAVSAANGLRDSVIGWVTNAISGIDWKGMSLNVAGLVNGLAARLRSIDWSTVNPVAVFLPLVGRLLPGLGQAITAARWIVSSENFSGLVASVRQALAAIDWGAVGEAVAGLAASVKQAILGLDWGSLTGVASSIQTEIGKLFAGVQLPALELPAIDTAGWGDVLQQIGDFLAPAMERLKEAMVGLPAAFGELGPKFEELGGAAGNLWNALQPALQAIGMGLALAANFGINAAAAALQQLPTIVGAVIDHITATIDLIAETLRGATQIVQSLIEGDWAGAWQGAQTIVNGFGEFFQDLISNISTILTGDVAMWGTTIASSLQDLGLTAAAEQVRSFVAMVEEVGKKLAGVFQGGWTFEIAVPEWLTQLLAWQWPTNWTWPELPDLSALKWPVLPQWVWPALPRWEWPSLPSFEWPALPQWSWPSFPAFRWPEIPMPGWLAQLQGFFGGNQLGTSYFGGGWTWVGESGRELVRLPRGAEVIPNRKAEAMASGPGGGVTVSVGQMVVRDEMDLYGMAYRMNDLLRRRYG